MGLKDGLITTAKYAGAGGLAGAVLVSVSGMTAVGAVGGGAGIGAAAGPVGAAAGAVTGIAVFSLVRTVDEPEVRKFVRVARRKVGGWIAGDEPEQIEGDEQA